MIVSLDEQSPDIAQGVDLAAEVRTGSGGEDQLNAQGAGDQGMMFGYACDETPDLMPLPIWLAHRLAQRLAQVRRAGELSYLRPDGKTQVSVVYEDDRPVALDTVLISTQHEPGVDLDNVLVARPDRARDRAAAADEPRHLERCGSSPTRPVVSSSAALEPTPGSPDERSSSTPTAGWPATAAARSPARTPRRWTAPLPTRRGGSPSTSSPQGSPAVARCRSPTRSASLIRSRFSSRHSAHRRSTSLRSKSAVREVFDLRPAAIVRDLDLMRPIYRRTAAYGHFGREDKEFTWEHTPRVDDLRRALSL